jgi:serine/threonine protein kinase
VALFTIQNEFRYDIVRKLYEGGMGIVYEAEQQGARKFIKRVAIKVVRQNYANQTQFIENFIGEAKLVADLIHTNIVQTYHLGETRGVFFIAMELIRGVNLEQFAQQLEDKRRRLPKELAIFIVSRVARGLAYAHSKTDKNGKPLGIVHRDVSFKNIMIAFEGDVKLTDFAGVVLAHLLLGKNIFKSGSAEESRQRIMSLPIPDFRNLDDRIDARLNDILHQALSRDLEKRYPNADLLLYDLEHYIYHTGYGPTNETLGKYIRELFGQTVPPNAPETKAKTELLEDTVRIRAKS